MSDRDWARKVLILLGLIVLVGLPLFLIARAIQLVLLLFLALLLALGLRGLAHALAQRLKLNRVLVLWGVVLALMLLTAGTLWFMIPRIAEQAQEFRTVLPQGAEQVRTWLLRSAWGQALVERIESANVLRDPKLLSRLGKTFSTALGAIANLVLLVALTLFLAGGLSTYEHGLLVLVPPSGRARARQILRTMGSTLQAWIVGRLVDMVLLGALTWLGLFLLGVPLAFILAVLAGLLNFIPNIGPIAAFIPAVLVALTKGPQTALWVAALYMGLQTVESYVLLPFIERKAVQIPPVLLIVAQIILGLSLGIMGLLLASPLLAILITAVRLIYREDILGESLQQSAPPRAPELEAPGED